MGHKKPRHQFLHKKNLFILNTNHHSMDKKYNTLLKTLQNVKKNVRVILEKTEELEDLILREGMSKVCSAVDAKVVAMFKKVSNYAQKVKNSLFLILHKKIH